MANLLFRISPRQGSDMSKIVEAAQAGGKMGKCAPAGGGKSEMPKGDGLKTAWKAERGGKIAVPMAHKKVR